MIRDHYNAVKALIEAQPALAGKGSDTVRVDAGGLPVHATYWVLFGGGPDELDDHRLSAPQRHDSDAEFVYTLRLVSTTADGVRNMTEKALPLIGAVPTVTGRVCSPLTIEFDDLDADTRVSPPLPFTDVEITLRSSRA